MLRHSGRTVDAFANGKEGLGFFRENSAMFTAVILDLEMPVMEVFTCFADLRKTRDDVPVVITTSHSSDYRVDDLLTQHTTCLVSKPYIFRELVCVQGKLAGSGNAEIASR